jgi:hypothetical protein
MHNEWIAAYYPSDLVEDQGLKTLFCLLYDRVVYHFPVSHMAFCGGHGTSDLFSDDPLVKEGVLDLREEFLLDEIDEDSYPTNSLDTDEEFQRYYDLNVTGMALLCCEKEGAVPATNRPTAPIPISLLRSRDLSRAAGIQAGALAIQSLDLALPQFSTLESHDILEAREKLKDQLVPFRSAMFALAPKVRSGINSDASFGELYKEARYLVETDVLPRLDNLKRRLELERGTFWRKLIQNVGSQLPSIALKWISGSSAAAAVDAAKLAGGTAAQAIDNDKLAHKVKGSSLRLTHILRCCAML